MILTRLRYIVPTFRVYRNPSLRFLDYAGLTRAGRVVQVILRSGLRFNIRTRTSDFGVLDDVFMRGVYNQALQHIGRGDVVVDIGAQCGAFAVAAGTLGARVFCYEPLPDNVALLQENARLNGCEERVTVEGMAVPAHSGRNTLYVVRGDTGGATFVPSIHPDWASHHVIQLSVHCVTLGEIFRTQNIEQCDCLKMDCEGAEYEILGAAEAHVLEQTRMVVLEYHPNGDVRAISDRLRESEFAVRISSDTSILLARRTS